MLEEAEYQTFNRLHVYPDNTTLVLYARWSDELDTDLVVDVGINVESLLEFAMETKLNKLVSQNVRGMQTASVMVGFDTNSDLQVSVAFTPRDQPLIDKDDVILSYEELAVVQELLHAVHRKQSILELTNTGSNRDVIRESLRTIEELGDFDQSMADTSEDVIIPLDVNELAGYFSGKIFDEL
jgi:hypothetical protein